MASQPKNHKDDEREHKREHEHEASTSAQPAPAPAKHNEPDPPVRTIADEQRERSAMIEKVGFANYVKSLDERTPEQQQSHPVAGVAHRPVEAVEAQRR